MQSDSEMGIGSKFVLVFTLAFAASGVALMPETAAAEDVYFKVGKEIPFEEIEFAVQLADPALRPVNEGEYTERSDCGVATIGDHFFEFSFDDLYDGSLALALREILNEGVPNFDDEYAPKCSSNPD